MHRYKTLMVGLARTPADAGLIRYAAMVARLGTASDVRFVDVLPSAANPAVAHDHEASVAHDHEPSVAQDHDRALADMHAEVQSSCGLSAAICTNRRWVALPLQCGIRATRQLSDAIDRPRPGSRWRERAR